MEALLKTPIHPIHVELGGQMVPFGGYDMPVRYSSIQEEHVAVRTAAGLFDVSHMSNLWVRGAHAADGLTHVSTADARAIKTGGTKYTTLLRPDGTIIDDMYYFKPRDAAEFHVVPNAGMNHIAADWIKSHTKAEVQDVTRETCIFALQGPKAKDILQPLINIPLADLKPFRCTMATVMGETFMISRTGYTGEDGFELFPSARNGPEIFRALLQAGKPHGLLPVGLGARDTLRLEKGYCLAGHEFAGGRSPVEASLDRFIHWDHDFIGKPVLLAQKEHPPARLVGLEVEDRGIPRQDCEVRTRAEPGRPPAGREGGTRPAGSKVGVVTSGTQSPTLKRGIALSYVEPGHAKPGTKLDIIIRGVATPATVVEVPFVK